MSSEKTDAVGWVILELMGHRRLAGYLRAVEMAGAPFLRIDVASPETAGESGPWQATQLYSPSAVYCVTPTTLEMVKAAAASSKVEPVSRWELPPARETEARVHGPHYRDPDYAGPDDPDLGDDDDEREPGHD